MSNIQREILAWFDENKRDLPWRKTKNPYFIWLSEVVLQQTTIKQGIPFFFLLIQRFPTLKDLALATESDVLLAWKGLGYYSRARNLQKAAQIIWFNLGGNFPNNQKELMRLPGIGPYTSAAISSIAFNERVSAIDGNVIRVITRLEDIATPVNTATTIQNVSKTAGELLAKNRPGDFNEAMMDLGSTICTPRSPKCELCPVSKYCKAFAQQTVLLRPLKKKKATPKNRFLCLYIVEKNGAIGFIHQNQKGIWRNLYFFPYIEYDSKEAWEGAFKKFKKSGTPYLKPSIHVLTHQKLQYFVVKGDQKEPGQLSFIDIQKISTLPAPILLPKIMDRIQNEW